MTPRENDAFGGETSPFLGEAPLRIAVRTGLDSFLDEETTGRLDTPWLNEEFLSEPFTAEDEVWNDSTEQLDFRERVMSAHIERSRKGLGKRTPLRDLRDDELAAVAGTGIKMRSDAAAQAGRLIKAANAALKNAQAAGDASAMVTTRITANSGYRGRDYQRGLWLDYFGGDYGYYNDSRKAREKLAAGPHSSEAVAYMLNTFGLPDKIAAPGYSNHQAGIAIDLMQKRKDGHRVRNSTNPGWRETWRKTWFHQWLKEHAASFGFVPYRKEEWHWEYKPDAAAKLQAGESLDDRELGAQEAEGCDADEVSEEQEPPSKPASSQHQQGTSQEPPGKTLYEDINLEIGTVPVQVLIQKQPEKKYNTVRVAVKPRTGIFIPDGYRTGAALDLVLYLHGHTTGYPGRSASIAEYWSDPKRYFALREQVNESGKNVVLIAPTLGPHSEAGSLDDAGGLDSFVSQVFLGLLKDPTFHNRQPQIASIILAGHSGAGKPMLSIALSGSPMASKIRECWLFDALYGGVSGWEKWIRTHPQGMFYSYHAGGSPTTNSRRLEKTLGQAGITNAVILPSAEMSGVKMPGHFQVPMTFFGKRLRETSWLQDRSPTVPEQEELSEWEDENGLEEELDSSDDEQTEPELRTFETQFNEEEEEEQSDFAGHEATEEEEEEDSEGALASAEPDVAAFESYEEFDGANPSDAATIARKMNEYDPIDGTAIVINMSEFKTGISGIFNYKNWKTDPTVKHNRNKRAYRHPYGIKHIVLHETASDTGVGYDDSNDYTAHMSVLRGATIRQFNDLAELENHGIGMNRTSIGIEFVNRGWLSSNFGKHGEGIPAKESKLTPAQRKRYGDNEHYLWAFWGGGFNIYRVPPSIAQLEKEVELVDWLVNGLPTTLGSFSGISIYNLFPSIDDTWLQLIAYDQVKDIWTFRKEDVPTESERASKNLFVMTTGYGFLTPSKLRSRSGIISHNAFYEDHNDGSFPALYTWLRLKKGKTKERAFDLCKKLMKNHHIGVSLKENREKRIHLLDVSDPLLV